MQETPTRRARVGSSQQRRMSSRLALASQSVEQESSQSLRSSKMIIGDSHDVVPEMNVAVQGSDVEEKEKEGDDGDASEKHHQVARQPRLDIEDLGEEEEGNDESQSQQLHVAAEQHHDEKSKEEKPSQSHQPGNVEVLIVHEQKDEDNKKEQSNLEKKKRERKENVDVEEPDVSFGRALLTLMEEDAKATVDLLERLTKDANSKARFRWTI